MTENNSNASAPVESGQTVIDFGKILRNYLRHWWWFAISLIVCVGLAFIYIKKKSPLFLIKGLEMVNQEEASGLNKAGGITSMMSMFGGGGSNYTNPENEMMRLTSQTNMTDVVNTYNLQYNYWTVHGILRKKEWLYKKSPIAISIPQAIIDTIGVPTLFHIEREAGEKDFTIEVEQKGDHLYDAVIKRFPYSARTPYGTFTITLTKHFNPKDEFNIYATAVSTATAVDDLRERVGVALISKKADAIEVSCEDVSIERGKDIVNTLMELHNNRRAADRMAHNRAALEFIDNRLLTLYNELDAQDTKVENFKRENRIVDAEAEAQYIFTRKGSIDEQYIQLKARQENYILFRDMLSNPATRDNQIPYTASELAMSEAFAQFMTNFNTLITQRMELETTAKAGNRNLEILNNKIDTTRATILKILNREIANIGTQLAQLSSEIKERDSRMAGMPAMEHRLLSFERDRVVKNQIYAYLLQKREETQIDMADDEPVAKIIDPAYNLLKPIAPKKLIILAVSFFIGLIIPIVWLQLRPAPEPAKRKDNEE